MKKTSKSFLVPVVAAIVALISTPSFAVTQKTADIGYKLSAINAVHLAGDANAKVIQMIRGNELHNLVLVKNNNGQIFAAHHSHRSHYSSRH